ncbi:hypothetical protein BDV26DRAFT_292215 [Aspergillus bertholletiae]|uniref:Uncharacterized protein n=1 Tax=Aspergillus bertholletiae TaxID=1226010 RepID=A0A5N7B9I7_9EURO|nr:hypothetical protein BDV26DRAFT_292215 [Aspergillus bertholletiae]
MLISLVFLVTLGAAFDTPFYIDNDEYFIRSDNLLSVPMENVTAAFKTPYSVQSTPIDGFDWTKSYPGSRIDGHTAYLEVSQEMPISESIVQNATTVLSALTFSIPESMSSGKQPRAMDSSWYICHHIFISTKPEVKSAVDSGQNCDFLSEECQNDLRTSLTKDWGTAAEDTMCSALGFDAIPMSCHDSFGYARQDVNAFDAEYLANTTLAPIMTDKEPSLYDWYIGTGYHDPGDVRAYTAATNRTYLVGTVWGYSKTSKNTQVPEVTFSCLSATNSSTTSTTTESSSPTADSTPSSTPNSSDDTYPMSSYAAVLAASLLSLMFILF